jgi:hypothetical protein
MSDAIDLHGCRRFRLSRRRRAVRNRGGGPEPKDRLLDAVVHTWTCKLDKAA